MTPRLEPRIARQAEVDTQCRHCSGGGACLLSGHQYRALEERLLHPMEVSLERNTLRLSTEGPVQSGGQKVMMFLVWQRAPLNN